MVTREVTVPHLTTTSTASVELLILGAGWTSTFLVPLLQKENISHAATSTTGHDNTIPFRFDPSSDSLSPFNTLPTAQTILITFPLKGEGQSKTLVDLYERSRPHSSSSSTSRRLYIQLGSTGIFTAPHWNTSSSSYDKTNARAIAEDELLSLSSAANATTASGASISTTVLNLAGLWGGERQPRNWLSRVIKKKSDVAGKKALHLVHGADVAQAILGAHQQPKALNGRRWIVNDLHVYDWWDLIVQWASEERAMTAQWKDDGHGPSTFPNIGLRDFEVQAEDGGEGETEKLDLQEVVFKNLEESGIRALPRDPDSLGRVLEGREIWKAIGRHPTVGRVN